MWQNLLLIDLYCVWSNCLVLIDLFIKQKLQKKLHQGGLMLVRGCSKTCEEKVDEHGYRHCCKSKQCNRSASLNSVNNSAFKIICSTLLCLFLAVRLNSFVWVWTLSECGGFQLQISVVTTQFPVTNLGCYQLNFQLQISDLNLHCTSPPISRSACK